MASSPIFRLRTALPLLVLAGAGVAAYFLIWKKPQLAPLPQPGSPLYEEYAEAFQVGVAALDVGLYELAQKKLTEAIEKIPEEPAAWANRGLLQLRNNQQKEAAADLQRAQALAPDSGEIESLLGLLADRQGKLSDAAAHYRKALVRDPQDIVTRYALAEILSREGGPESDAEYQEQLAEILRVQPNNLFVLAEYAGVAARRSDAAALRAALQRLRQLDAFWSPDNRKRLQSVEKAAAGPLPGDMPSALIEFKNCLVTELGFARSSAAVGSKSGGSGNAVEHFLRLARLRPTPAAPDTALAFSPEPFKAIPGRDATRWNTVQAVWLTDGPEPAVFVASGRELRRVDAAAPALPFPSGPKVVPPTVAGVLGIDWNNDYRTDLLLAGAGGLRFFQQSADGKFTDVTARTGLDQTTLQADYYGAWAADLDMDGDLDIIVAPRHGPPLGLRNNRDGTFKALQPFAGVETVRRFVWADFDNDGAPDAAFLDAEGKIHVFANERSGQFRKREVPSDHGKALALAVADVTDDGVFDLLALRAGGGIMRLSDREKGKSWDVAEVVGGPTLSTSLEPGDAVLLIADLDNNGSLDLIASTADGTRVWLGDTAGRFQPLPSAPAARVAAAVDPTRNGRLDLLALSDAGQPIRLVNKGTREYHWQAVRPHATRDRDVTADNRINSFGIGGEIELRTGTIVQKQPITGPVIHFGLGERRMAELVRIVWPNGKFQVEFEKAGDQVITADQRITGSCPFLFTYDGRGMQFVTDFMWSTPLGMYINAQAKGGFLQTTEWVKVRGDQLVPRDGLYDVRVTGNLWEAHYYDHMALMVVDHPADTEIYADERFFLTPTKPQLFVTEPPQPIARAWDDNGQDVAETIRAMDGKYLDTFGRGRFQGITRDHWVEVDLGGEAPKEGPIYLLAHGWLHPTDSSINFAIEQGNHEKPRGLVLEVPDGKGGWKIGRNALGFPAGKNKTILIRLDGITGKEVTRRFRLRTNMEIYWDALAYARGLDAELARPQNLQPHEAELRFHGIDEITAANPSSPELPHYGRPVSRTQYWRDLIGYYTRFGDVRELLAEADDRYVIMNAGDEIAMKFRVPDGPPPGWKRDFVWVSDGWTKDGNLNTHFSKTVLPLPYHDMKSYDRPPGPLEDDPVYQRFPQDWRKYHTRYVTPDVFEQGLRSFRRPRP